MERSSVARNLAKTPNLLIKHTLIYSRSPAGFDEQTAFTLRVYRKADWDKLRLEQRPRYGDPNKEAETAQEDVSV